MTESQFTSKLLRALKQHPALAEWRDMIWKISDRFGAGRPDIQIFTGHTNYFELKVWPEKPTKIQSFFLSKLGKRGYWIQFRKEGEHMLLTSNNDWLLINGTMKELVDRVVYRCVNV